MTLPIGVLVSGSGSNLQSIIDAQESGKLDVSIKCVVSNVKDAFGLERAKKHTIPAEYLNHKEFSSRDSFDQAMVDLLKEYEVQAVVLAGFMRIVTPVFLNSFKDRVINIHPALLPSFPGIHGQGDAADYGVKISGCTVHFVDHKVDHGPIIIQAAVPALEGDDGSSLGKRILAMEHRIYPQAIQWLAEDRLTMKGRKVVLEPKEKALANTPHDVLVSPPLEEGF